MVIMLCQQLGQTDNWSDSMVQTDNWTDSIILAELTNCQWATSAMAMTASMQCASGYRNASDHENTPVVHSVGLTLSTAWGLGSGVVTGGRYLNSWNAWCHC